MGFVISVLFLLLEAFINTKINDIDRLTSGSLALNVFANIAVAILAFIIYLVKYKRINKITALISSITILIIVLGSGTRGAMLSLLLSLVLLYILEKPKKAIKKILVMGVFSVLLFSVYLKALEIKLIPHRYSYSYITDRVKINFKKNRLTEIVEIKKSYETNSIIARITLFESSLNMILFNPLTGIGAGRWNRYKNTYSDGNKVYKVLLDSHNDYLSIVSQYGIPLGLLMSYLVFLYPFKSFREQKKDSITAFHLLFVISFTMGIAALSNSGFFKHQIAAILFFCLCVSDQIIYENRMSNDL
jgi:O-antigen ligase